MLIFIKDGDLSRISLQCRRDCCKSRVDGTGRAFVVFMNPQTLDDIPPNEREVDADDTFIDAPEVVRGEETDDDARFEEETIIPPVAPPVP